MAAIRPRSITTDTGFREVRYQRLAPYPRVLANVVISDSGGKYPCWMLSDKTLVSALRTTLRTSTNDGASWSDIHVFDDAVTAVREFSNGELVVATDSSRGKLYVSSGWASNPSTATWTLKVTSSAAGNYFANSWSMDSYGTIGLAAEYGNKDGVANARYVYLTRDSGATWSTIYDLGNDEGRHLHGVAYDQYWDRIWISTGDDVNTVEYSDNWGRSWVVAHQDNDVAGDYQSVGIIPMPSAVLFSSDGSPNGINRIPRKSSRTDLTFEAAYSIDSASTLTALGQGCFRHDGATDAPALFGIQPTNGVAGYSRLIASVDGESFYEVWRDTLQTTDKGVMWIVGPTATGKYVGTINDGRQANYSMIVADAPDWHPVEGTDNAQQGVIAPSSNLWWPSGNAVTANRAYYARFLCTRPMDVASVAFVVSTPAGSDDECCVAIYDSSMRRLATSGAVSGKLNGSGVQTVTITTSLKAGGVYYAAFSAGTIGSSAASLVMTAYGNIETPELFGTGNGVRDCGIEASAHPCPTTGTIGDSQLVPIMAVREA